MRGEALISISRKMAAAGFSGDSLKNWQSLIRWPLPWTSSYGNWESASGAELTLATIFFAFQIYCDFSAYSDIAIGTAKLFGIKLMRNFAYPYFSQSVGEFWRRWHISLSTWFRDYVYIPLGGSHVGKTRGSLNLMLTFLLSGLWHGAAWTFVAWGGLHGAVLTGQKVSQRESSEQNPSDKKHHLGMTPGGERFFPHPIVSLKILLTFSVVCCGWVFFRAKSMAEALGILGRIFTDSLSAASRVGLKTFVDAHETTLIVLCMFILIEWIRRRHECPLSSGPKILIPVRWAVYTGLIWGSLYLIADIDEQPFIYFAF